MCGYKSVPEECNKTSGLVPFEKYRLNFEIRTSYAMNMMGVVLLFGLSTRSTIVSNGVRFSL